jgi:DNA-binding transcriptional LysR family regulator
VASFLKAYPEIRLEVIVEDGFVDVLGAGCDAGIRYDEQLEQDMIAVPIGPRVQRFATAASPDYLDARRRPEHPRDLLAHACLRGQFASAAVDLAVSAAVAGLGIIYLFEEWLRPHLDSGALEPVLASWWQNFSGPFLYYAVVDICPRRCALSSTSSRIRAAPFVTGEFVDCALCPP